MYFRREFHFLLNSLVSKILLNYVSSHACRTRWRRQQYRHQCQVGYVFMYLCYLNEIQCRCPWYVLKLLRNIPLIRHLIDLEAVAATAALVVLLVPGI